MQNHWQCHHVSDGRGNTGRRKKPEEKVGHKYLYFTHRVSRNVLKVNGTRNRIAYLKLQRENFRHLTIKCWKQKRRSGSTSDPDLHLSFLKVNRKF